MGSSFSLCPRFFFIRTCTRRTYTPILLLQSLWNSFCTVRCDPPYFVVLSWRCGKLLQIWITARDTAMYSRCDTVQQHVAMSCRRAPVLYNNGQIPLLLPCYCTLVRCHSIWSLTRGCIGKDSLVMQIVLYVNAELLFPHYITKNSAAAVRLTGCTFW